jgi:hypothetical protein
LSEDQLMAITTDLANGVGVDDALKNAGVTEEGLQGSIRDAVQDRFSSSWPKVDDAIWLPDGGGGMREQRISPADAIAAFKPNAGGSAAGGGGGGLTQHNYFNQDPKGNWRQLQTAVDTLGLG